MDDLIEVLTILKKYASDYAQKYPTHCSHDVMTFNVDVEKISADDLARLEELGCYVMDEHGEPSLQSFRYGSC